MTDTKTQPKQRSQRRLKKEKIAFDNAIEMLSKSKPGTDLPVIDLKKKIVLPQSPKLTKIAKKQLKIDEKNLKIDTSIAEKRLSGKRITYVEAFRETQLKSQADPTNLKYIEKLANLDAQIKKQNQKKRESRKVEPIIEIVVDSMQSRPVSLDL